jgi:hypothetical protein
MLRDALWAKGQRFNSPPTESELANIISKMKYPPSEALVELWRNVGEGPLPNSWDITLCRPGEEVTFTEGDRFSEYEGAKRLIGSSGAWIGRLWDGTDSVTYMLEVNGSVVGFSYGDFKMYSGAKTTRDLIDFMLRLPANTEYWEVSGLIFDAIFKPANGESA